MRNSIIPIKPEFVSEILGFMKTLQFDLPLRRRLKESARLPLAEVLVEGRSRLLYNNVGQLSMELYGKKGLQTEWFITPQLEAVNIREYISPQNLTSIMNFIQVGANLVDRSIEEIAEVEAQSLFLKEVAALNRNIRGSYEEPEKFRLGVKDEQDLLMRRKLYKEARIKDYKETELKEGSLELTSGLLRFPVPDKKG